MRRRRADRVPLRLNRNLMNFPVARDARTILDWARSRETGRWIAELPYEERILLILPEETAKADRRGPTGADMNVLFALMAEAQRTESTNLTIKLTEILRRVGLATHKDNRATITAAFDLWSRLRIQIECWYTPGAGTRGVRVLPAPIKRIQRRGQRYMITLHDRWGHLALTKSYYERISLPLPNLAADQNAALMLLTSPLKPWHDGDVENMDVYYTRRQSSFARKIGLSTSRRRERLTACLDRVSEWFEESGGELMVVVGRYDAVLPAGKLGFVGKPPAVPRWKDATVTRSRNVSGGGIGRSRNDSNARVGRSRNYYDEELY